MKDWSRFELDYETRHTGGCLVVHADCLEWLGRIPNKSLHAIVTDPPYGLKEYDFDQLRKRKNGRGGVWRIPPSFDGSERTPLPRFTDLSDDERNQLSEFFQEWAFLAARTLRPGGHVFLACNTFLAPLVYNAISEGGLEYRGQIIRNGVMTLRGGDRPKGAEQEFSEVCTMPRGCYEPWGLFRNPIPTGMRISDCLRKYGTGGLRRLPDGRPFMDVIQSQRTPSEEREVSDHSSLKPQAFLRKLVHASLPLGEGVICDPFMGSGSTLAAAESLGISSIGVERRQDDFDQSIEKIEQLARITVKDDQLELSL